MENKTGPVTQTLQNTFVYSCASEKMRVNEQFVAEHLLAYQLSGETEIYHQQGTFLLKKGGLLLARKNQLAKSIKIPGADEDYKIIAVTLSRESLQQFALENHITGNRKYNGDNNLVLAPNALWSGYFQSLLPYMEMNQISDKLTMIKTNEAVELLLQLYPALHTFLFDFSEPHKIDLEKFMQQNYHFNVPVADFARLTGRSLAGFKRDFTGTFGSAPRKWLQDKRLTEAHFLIREKKQKPADIYLDLGFENLSHFYTSFKQKFGATPAEL
jgi:AraC-like DNA-binding protein